MLIFFARALLLVVFDFKGTLVEVGGLRIVAQIVSATVVDGDARAVVRRLGLCLVVQH